MSTNNHRNIPGILLSIDKDNKCKVLVVSEKSNKSNSDERSESEVLPWTKQLNYPHNKKPEVISITFKDVQVISNKTIRIQENDILKEWKRMETLYV